LLNQIQTHFAMMRELEKELPARKCEIVSHRWEGYAFGSWTLVIRKGGVIFQLVFDGKDGDLITQNGGRGTGPSATYKTLQTRKAFPEHQTESVLDVIDHLE
jgi:hypothetical protein